MKDLKFIGTFGLALAGLFVIAMGNPLLAGAFMIPLLIVATN